MKIVKINNLTQANGRADYKGLDISKIVGGSALYPSYDNVSYLFYDGEVIEGVDIQLVTQETYDSHKQRIEDELSKIVTPEKRIETLETENVNLKQQQVLMKQALDDILLGGI